MRPLVHAENRDPAEAISPLTTELTDLIDGYKIMAKEAEPDLKPYIERLLAMHEAHAAKLLNLSVGLGGTPESAGSAMGVVNTAVAYARGLMGSLDGGGLDDILSREKSVLKTYDEAAEAVSGMPEALEIVTQQRDALAETVTALQQ